MQSPYLTCLTTNGLGAKWVDEQFSLKNKPLQGMAPTECTQSAYLFPCLLACLPACLPACLLACLPALLPCLPALLPCLPAYLPKNPPGLFRMLLELIFTIFTDKIPSSWASARAKEQF